MEGLGLVGSQTIEIRFEYDAAQMSAISYFHCQTKRARAYLDFDRQLLCHTTHPLITDDRFLLQAEQHCCQSLHREL